MVPMHIYQKALGRFMLTANSLFAWKIPHSAVQQE